MKTNTDMQTPIQTTDGASGTLIGDTIRWAGGNTAQVLDRNFPPLRTGRRIVQRTLRVRADDGREGLIFIKASE